MGPLVNARAQQVASRAVPGAEPLVSTSGRCPATEIRRRAVALASACLLQASVLDPAAHAFGLIDGSLAPCKAGNPCVSTSAFNAPASYMPPWSFEPTSQDAAFRQLLEVLNGRGATLVEADEQRGYIAAEVPAPSLASSATGGFLDFIRGSSSGNGPDAQASGSGGGEPQQGGPVDDVEFLLRPGLVLFRSQLHVEPGGSAPPPPPFCITPGCITGPANRQRLAELRNALQWQDLETDEDKQWVQIMLH